MGTLTITYNGTTKTYTQSGAPSVTYGGGVKLSAGSWSGTKTLTCAGKLMKSDVKVGDRTLTCAGKLAKTNIVLNYTVNTSIYYEQVLVSNSSWTVPAGYNRVQFFCVGGGGGGSNYTSYTYTAEGGGGGGYTKTSSVITTSSGTKYKITIGAGGSFANGGTTSVVNSSGTTLASAAGGYQGTSNLKKSSGAGCQGGNGGSGGGGGRWAANVSDNSAYGYISRGGRGGTNGGNGEGAMSYSLAKGEGPESSGQGTTTQNNWNSSGTVITYAEGGEGGYVVGSYGYGGGSLKASVNGCGLGIKYTHYPSYTVNRAPTSGSPNTGSGAGGAAYDGRKSSITPTSWNISGGSGIVVIKCWEA